MTSLRFKGDITLDEVFDHHRIAIYDRVVEAIKNSYQDPSIPEVKVVNIEINETEYSINLARAKFIGGLESAMSAYEKIEEYEKCQLCLDIIKELKKIERTK